MVKEINQKGRCLVLTINRALWLTKTQEEFDDGCYAELFKRRL
jgi:hypothetical protein